MTAVSQCVDAKAPSSQGIHKYTIPVTVKVDDPTDGAGTVTSYLYATLYPRTSPYQEDNYIDILSIVKYISAVRQSGSALVWNATVHYGPINPTTEEEQANPADGATDNPLLFRWDVSVTTVPYEVAARSGWNIDAYPKPPAAGSCEYVRGANTLGPIVNSAGVPFDPPPSLQNYDTIYRFSGNYPFHDDAYISPKVGRLNSTTYEFSDILIGNYGMAGGESFPAYTLKCSAVNAQYMRTNGIEYWKYDYEFRVRYRNAAIVAYEPSAIPDGWLEQYLDQGAERYADVGCDDGDGGTWSSEDLLGAARAMSIKGPDGKRIANLVLLDGHGQPDAAPVDGVWFRYRLHETSSFAGATLPLDLFKLVI